MHSSISKDTLKRKKHLYFSLWLFRYTKSLDLTANNGARHEFRIPDISDEPYLLLCPYLNLLTLISSNQTFAAPKLNSLEQLFRFRIPLEQKQLPVPLKQEIQHISLFRQSKNMVNRVCISNDQALPNSAL